MHVHDSREPQMPPKSKEQVTETINQVIKDGGSPGWESKWRDTLAQCQGLSGAWANCFL